ncbi:Clp protease
MEVMLKDWAAIILAMIAIAGHLKGFFSSGEKELATALGTIATQRAEDRKTLIDHDRRIQSIESEMKHLPDREAAHRLEMAMEKISSRLDVITERLKPIEATNERLNELLLERAGQK